MKNLLNKLIIAAALIIYADGVTAQVGIGFGTNGFGIGMNIPVHKNNKKRSERTEQQVQQLKQDLDLNDEQVVKVRSLLIDRDRSHERSARKAMTHEQFDQRMQEILSAEQYTKFSELKQQKREEKKEIRKEDSKEPVPPSQWDDVYR